MDIKMLLKQRKHLASYIDDLKKIDSYDANVKIKKEKEYYTFINNLIKVGTNSERTNQTN